jgi:ssDNA-binding replication factor A large subunit
MRAIDMEGLVTVVGPAREVQTRFGPARVAVARLQDETGSIRLNLWRDQIDAVKAGLRIRLINAFATEFAGMLELNVSGDGRIVVIERGGEGEGVS